MNYVVNYVGDKFKMLVTDSTVFVSVINASDCDTNSELYKSLRFGHRHIGIVINITLAVDMINCLRLVKFDFIEGLDPTFSRQKPYPKIILTRWSLKL